MKYKPLAKEVKKKGIFYKEHYREKDFVIYSMGNSKSAFLGYEIFEVKRHDGYIIAGNKIEASECFASDEDFGVSAFHCADLKRAELRLQQLKDLKKLRDTAREERNTE